MPKRDCFTSATPDPLIPAAPSGQAGRGTPGITRPARRTLTATGALAGALLVVLAGCGGGGITPGHATPQDAVDGLIHSELGGNGSQACSYLVPQMQGSCDQQASQVPAFTGSATVKGAMISGDHALVKVTGRLCVSGSGCTSNSNPAEGMPASPAGFTQVYQRLVSGAGNGNFSPVPCVRENGKWYVGYGS